MKITDHTPYVSFDAYTQKTRDRVSLHRGEDAGGSAPAPSDKVVLSPKAREIQDASRMLQSLPEVREDKVDRIRLEIEKGTYGVDGGKIAEKMLAEMAANLAP